MPLTPTDELLLDAWEPVSEIPSWQWAEENVQLGSDSELKRMSFDLVPMAKFYFECADNPRVKKVTQMVSAQSTKTVSNLAKLCHNVRNKPRDAIWYTDTAGNAKLFYKIKAKPFFENCEPVARMMPSAREKRTNTLIQFDSMNLHILGAEAQGNREGKTAFEVYMDEVRNYPPGAVASIDNRFKTVRSYKRYMFSTAGVEFDQLHNAWLEGTRRFFFWTCPHCQHKQTFRFGRKPSPFYPEERECGGFVWDTNDVTMPKEGVYNFAELVKTVRYECENPSCRHHFRNEDKLHLIKNLEPIQTNPDADPENESMTWWEAYMPWADCDWGKIVCKFLRAKNAMKRGDFEPMKTFVQETLGEPWRVPTGDSVTKGKVMERCGSYAVGECWDNVKDAQGRDSVAFIMTNDIQQGYVYSVLRQVRSQSAGGGNRLIEATKLPGFDDIRHYQVAHKVKDHCVGLDCAYRPADVFEACARYGRWQPCPTHVHRSGFLWTGWKPMIGSDWPDFKHNVNGVSVKRYWREYDRDPNIGKAGHSKQIRVWEISKSHYRERLFMYCLKGLVPGWEIPSNVDPEYVQQMGHVHRVPVLDAGGAVVGYEWKETGRHDYPDCEQFQIAFVDILEAG